MTTLQHQILAAAYLAGACVWLLTFWAILKVTPPRPSRSCQRCADRDRETLFLLDALKAQPPAWTAVTGIAHALLWPCVTGTAVMTARRDSHRNHQATP